ncbi:hypothetical protein [Catenulispora pinisilvae]|uniref:hypothetical protein n=1 Tax=Catenulispora pinisilvae TaxID=2705253 RepID=UPI0018925AEF|nr:hypothetical protein [Catenulispora pinisilvae]
MDHYTPPVANPVNPNAKNLGDLYQHSGVGPYSDSGTAPIANLVDTFKFVGDPTSNQGYTYNQAYVAMFGGWEGGGSIPMTWSECKPETWQIAWESLAGVQLALYAYATWMNDAIEAAVGEKGSAWSGQAADVFYQLADKVYTYINGVADEIGKLTGLTAANVGTTPTAPTVLTNIPAMLSKMNDICGLLWSNSAVGDGHDRMALMMFYTPSNTSPWSATDATLSEPALTPVTMWNCSQLMAQWASNVYAGLIPTIDILNNVTFNPAAPNLGKDPSTGDNTNNNQNTDNPNLDKTLDNINKGLGGLGGLGNDFNKGLGGLGNDFSKGLGGLGDDFSKGLGGIGDDFSKGLGGIGDGLNGLGKSDSNLGTGLDNLLKGLGGPGPNVNLAGLGSVKDGLGGLGGLTGIGGLNGTSGLAGLGGLGGGSGLSGLGGLGGLGGADAVGGMGGLGSLGALGAGSAGALGSEAAAQEAAAEGSTGMPFYPPMGGMMGQQGQSQGRERDVFLEEDEDVWGAGVELAPPVLGLSDPKSERRASRDGLGLSDLDPGMMR